MATTLGSAHGEERKCASCGLTYRYQQAKTFVCMSCDTQQPWGGWVGQNTKAGESSIVRTVEAKTPPYTRLGSDDRVGTISGPEALALPTTYEPVVQSTPLIDLHAVHATLNQMSADGLRQLHDRLAILQMVAVANEADDPEYYARVRQALAGAGVRF